MLEMGCIYRSAEEIANVSFLWSEAALIIGILDCKCCFTLHIVREGFISTIQLDVSRLVDAHSKSSVLSAQPLLVAFCDAACHVLVLDLSAKLHPTGGGEEAGGGVHFKGKTTDSSARQGCVPVDRAALSLFGLSTGGSSATSGDDAQYVDQDQAAVEYMSREETSRCVVQSCRFDQCGSSELLDPKGGRYSRHPLLAASSEALIVRATRRRRRMRSGHQSSSSCSDDTGSVEMVKVRLNPSAVAVDLLRLHVSSRAEATTTTGRRKVEHLKKYFDELTRRTSRNATAAAAAAVRNKSYKAVSQRGELQPSGHEECVVINTDTRSWVRRGDTGLGFNIGSFAAPDPKKIAVSFAAARQLGSSGSCVSLVKVVVVVDEQKESPLQQQQQQQQQEEETAFVVPIMSGGPTELMSDMSSKDNSSSSSLGGSTQYPAAVYQLLSRAHSGGGGSFIDARSKSQGGLEFLDLDDSEACLAFIESCIAWRRGSSFMHVPSEEAAAALETIAAMLLSLSSGEEQQQQQQHDDAEGVACNEFLIGTLACEEGMICLYHLPLEVSAVEQGTTTSTNATTTTIIPLEPICLLNIKQCLPLDLYCAGVDWRIARMEITRRHIIVVCTARAPAYRLNACRIVILCLADYTVESVFALPDEDIFLCMIIRQTGMGSGHVETDRCGMGDTLVLVQTRQLLYCIREQLLYRQDRAADDDSSQSGAWDKHVLSRSVLSIPPSGLLHASSSSLLQVLERRSSNPAAPWALLEVMACRDSGAGMSSYHHSLPSSSSIIQTSLLIRACSDFGGCLATLFWFLDTSVSSTSTSSSRDLPLLERLQSIMMCVARVHLLITERLSESLSRYSRRGGDTGRQHSGLVNGLVLLLSLLQPYLCDSDTLEQVQQSSQTSSDADSSSSSSCCCSLRRIIKLSVELYTVVGNLESKSMRCFFNSAALQSTMREFSSEVGRCFMRCASQLGHHSRTTAAGAAVHNKIGNIIGCNESSQSLHLTILLQHVAAGSSITESSSSSQRQHHHRLYHLYPRYLELSIYRAELRSRILEGQAVGVDLELLLCRDVFQYLRLFMQNAVTGSRSLSDPAALTLAQSAIAEVLVLWQRRSIACQYLEQEILQWMIASPPESDSLVSLLLDAFMQLFFKPLEQLLLLLPCTSSSGGVGVSAKAALRSMQFSSSFLMKILRYKVDHHHRCCSTR